VLDSQGLKELIMATVGRFKLFIMLLCYSGARISEVMALQMKHINNPKKGVIRIEQKLSAGRIKGIAQPDHYFGPTKSPAGYREVPLLDRSLIQLLTEAKASSEGQGIFGT
jgi:integrase